MCLKYASKIPEISLKYAIDMPEKCLRYLKDKGDTSKSLKETLVD